MSNGTELISSLNDTYNSIEELPYWNWDKVIQTNDLRFLCKNFKYNFSNSDKAKSIELSEHVDKLYEGKELAERELVIKHKHEDKYLKEILKYNKGLEIDIQTKILELKFSNPNILLRPNKKLSELWMELQDEHLIEFGDPATLKTRVRSLKKLGKLNLKFIKTREMALLNLIKIEELKQEEATGEHMSMYKLLDLMTTKKGFDIDPNKYSVMKWFHALKNMVKDGKDNTKG